MLERILSISSTVNQQEQQRIASLPAKSTQAQLDVWHLAGTPAAASFYSTKTTLVLCVMVRSAQHNELTTSVRDHGSLAAVWNTPAVIDIVRAAQLPEKRPWRTDQQGVETAIA